MFWRLKCCEEILRGENGGNQERVVSPLRILRLRMHAIGGRKGEYPVLSPSP
jgi:hypothetical protein